MTPGTLYTYGIEQAREEVSNDGRVRMRIIVSISRGQREKENDMQFVFWALKNRFSLIYSHVGNADVAWRAEDP
jgi:hypothetical protein